MKYNVLVETPVILCNEITIEANNETQARAIVQQHLDTLDMLAYSTESLPQIESPLSPLNASAISAAIDAIMTECYGAVSTGGWNVGYPECQQTPVIANVCRHVTLAECMESLASLN
ncbi:MAG: hypothetical protein LC114_04280 [Bryobacterales bacterium]|nr:hypothetical protein [Bryobacterales bacterium]